MGDTDWGIEQTGAGGPERAPYPGGEEYEEPESSLPWQQRHRYSSWLVAMLQTIKVVLLEPSQAFSRIKVEGSLGESLVFVLILGTVAGYIGSLWQILFHLAGFSMAAGAFPERGTDLVALLGMTVYGAAVIVVVPIGVVVSSFIASGILHLCLMIVGGANRTFEATYAVVAYVTGCTSLFNLVPMCGGLIAGVWAIVGEILGVREAHKTTTGKAVLAVLLPLICCCGLAMLSFVLFGAFAAAAR